MRCDRVRILLSAMLDGEASDREAASAEAHLARCAACAGWYAAAVLVTRRVRTTLSQPSSVPAGLAAAVAAAAPGRGRARAARALRVLLSVLGVGQFALGVGQIASLRLFAGTGAAGGMSSDHLLHESAAWNVAIGAGFCWVAARRGKPATMLPIMTAFVGVLLLLSIGDLMAGRVAAVALLTHLFVIIGYAILLVLRRPAFEMSAPPAGRAWRLVDLPDEEPRSRTLGPAPRDVSAYADRSAAA